jgi:hypothetical protein
MDTKHLIYSGILDISHHCGAARFRSEHLADLVSRSNTLSKIDKAMDDLGVDVLKNENGIVRIIKPQPFGYDGRRPVLFEFSAPGAGDYVCELEEIPENALADASSAFSFILTLINRIDEGESIEEYAL